MSLISRVHNHHSARYHSQSSILSCEPDRYSASNWCAVPGPKIDVPPDLLRRVTVCAVRY
eukprot:2749868-Rhodomonas_salina.1